MTDAYTAPVSAQPSVAPASPVASQPSATDRLEALLKQLQEEQMAAPAVSSTPAAPASTTDTANSGTRDFASVLSRMPTTAPADLPDTPTVLNSLDEVIRTIGERYAVGQPDLPELLATAKQTTGDLGSVSPAVMPTQSTEPMTFVRPQNGIPQAPAAIPPELPKVTVMPTAEPSLDVSSTSAPMVTPTAPAMLSVAAVPTTVTPAAEPQLKPRILTQYLSNLAGHLKMHGQLDLPNYSKFSALR